MFTEAIRNLLVVDANVTSKLATYEFTTGATEPAIFTIDPAPKDADSILVVLMQMGTGYFGSQGIRGGEVLIDAMLWGDKNRSEQLLFEAAMAIWSCLDRARAILAGWFLFSILCYLPERLTDVDGFPGYRIRMQLLALEN